MQRLILKKSSLYPFRILLKLFRQSFCQNFLAAPGQQQTKRRPGNPERRFCLSSQRSVGSSHPVLVKRRTSDFGPRTYLV